MQQTFEKTDKVYANEMQPGDIKEIKVNGRRILICCTDENEFKAVSAICPHQQADLIHVKKLEGEVICTAAGDVKVVNCNKILRCPRHAYEWNVEDGNALFETDRLNLQSYDVTVENGEVIVNV